MDVDVPAKQGLHSSTSLHCIAEIRAHWAETKPSITLNIITRLFDNAAFVCIQVVARFSKDLKSGWVEKSRVSASG